MLLWYLHIYLTHPNDDLILRKPKMGCQRIFVSLLSVFLADVPVAAADDDDVGLMLSEL